MKFVRSDGKALVEVFGEAYDIAVSNSKRYVAGLSDVRKPEPNAYGKIWVFDIKSRKTVFTKYLTKLETNRFWSLHWNRTDQLLEGRTENESSEKQEILWDPRKRK